MSISVWSIGLFLPKLSIPSQWPRFFSKDLSEKLAIDLSALRSTCINKQKETFLTLYSYSFCIAQHYDRNTTTYYPVDQPLFTLIFLSVSRQTIALKEFILSWSRKSE